MAKEKGKVKWFNDAKGFGFIERAGGADLFLHHTAIKDQALKSLSEGDNVEFDVADGEKGPVAQNVVKIN
jgi:CspA family cold shock protein